MVRQGVVGGADSVAGMFAGKSYSFCYLVKNTGDAALGVGAAAVSGESNCVVTVVGQPVSPVAAGGFSTLALTVLPQAAGAWSFSVSLPTDDADENPVAWTVSGTAVTSAGEVTAKFQDGVFPDAGYAGTADSYIYNSTTRVNTNYGSDSTLMVSGIRMFFLRWDIASLPPNATVLSGSVDLYQAAYTDATKTVALKSYRVLCDWTEAGVTWMSYAVGTPWEEPGALSLNDKNPTVLAEISALASLSPQWRTLPLNAQGKSVVQSWIEDSATNFGFKVEGASLAFTFASSEDSTPANRPLLNIVYTTDLQPEIVVTRGVSDIADGETDSLSGFLPNAASSVTYTISNSGSVPLCLLGAVPVAVSGETNCAVSIVTQPTSPLANGQTTDVVFSVTPTNPGLWSFVVTMGTNDLTGDEANYSWTVNGVAYSSKIAVTREGASVVDGGSDMAVNTQPSVNKDLFYLVSNAGNAAVTLGNATISNAVNCSPTIQTQLPASLAVGDTAALDIAVVPAASGAWSFDVSFSNNDPYASPYNWTVSGTASNVMTMILNDGEDTNIYYAFPDASYGEVASLTFNTNATNLIKALLRWDLRAIPSAAIVTGVGVKIFAQDATATTISFYKMLRSWSESAATWNKYDGSNSWGTAGASGVSDAGTTSFGGVAKSTTVDAEASVILDANGIACVQEWVGNHAGNNGFLLVKTGGSNNGDIHSFEATNAAYRPKLTISYTMGGTPAPEISVSSGGQIVSGSVTPSTSNGTDFGTVEFFAEDASKTQTFYIENLGAAGLSLTGTPLVSISGDHASDFTVVQQPSSAVGAFQKVRFKIAFNPSAKGVRNATVTISNSDADEGTFTFALQGTGGERALRLLFAGNSFMSPGSGFQQMGGIVSIAAADGHPTPLYDDHNGAGADALDQRYGRTAEGAPMDPIWWMEGVANKGVIYESPKVAGGLTWDCFIINTNSEAFSDSLPKWDARQSDGIADPPDWENEQSCLVHWAKVFEWVKEHSPAAKYISYESWVRSANNNDDWYDIQPGSGEYWTGGFPAALEKAQAAARFTYLRAAVDANETYGNGTGRIARNGEGFRVKNWDDTKGGVYRWLSAAREQDPNLPDVDKHASSRGELLGAMITYGTIYQDDVSDIRGKNAAAVTSILSAINLAPEGAETELTTADWDALADIADRVNGQGVYPKVVVSAESVTVNEGGTASFQVRLSKAPAAPVTVTVSNGAGDADISVSGGGSLVFDSSNWNDWQTVTLAAASDVDTVSSEALIRLVTAAPGALPGAAPNEVIAVENDGVASAYDTWASSLAAENRGLLAVPHGDGVTNLARYALGIGAAEAAAGKLPTTEVSGANLLFRFRRERGDVDYIVQTSTDLVSWTIYQTYAKAGFASAADIVETVPISGTKTFVRLRVVK